MLEKTRIEGLPHATVIDEKKTCLHFHVQTQVGHVTKAVPPSVRKSVQRIEASFLVEGPVDSKDGILGY